MRKLILTTAASGAITAALSLRRAAPPQFAPLPRRPV